ncbi:uncharacterized protein PV09_01409 [Verruconis gallopava]|uniref:RING-type E3 ubiquitin transferase n=1 Tax=Verruconis gallopava TaxID=253628 RepID=A0A0D2BB87_9PEZI|nr:uncharacterized protein PV09_01409 [Verruconis gallopava]KIW08519.1 hypothetical protein PV09_01409 [Verruconis gallopava]
MLLSSCSSTSSTTASSARAILSAILLASLVAAQSLNASDTFQSSYPTGNDQIQLSPPIGYGPPSAQNNTPRINLVNLTVNAVTKLSAEQGENVAIHENIVFFPPNSSFSIAQFSNSNIAIICCDEAPGFLQPIQAVQDAVSQSSPAIVLYSTRHDFCNLETGGTIPSSYAIYSTNDPSAWVTIEAARAEFAYNGQYPTQWLIARKTVLDNITMSSNNGNSGGYGFGSANGSPSTAVAMIILYSITGVITALFLIIIITGAVRAHRHPERYGPRNVLGRPRQSRAKGLARAMLDTIPIVKFGERDGERPKPTDVEMTSAEPRPSSEHHDANDATKDQKATTLDSSQPVAATEAGDSSTARDPAAAATTPSTAEESVSEPANDEDAPTCSICTDEFERGQDVRVLPCEHQFHPACIDPWLLNVSGTCPLCRIDLRPANEQEGEFGRPSVEGPLPPPLEADGPDSSGLHPGSNRASRRLSGFITDILNPSRMQSASREERIAALRRLREQRAQSGAEEVETRRRRRLTARLGETFGVRTRARGTSPPASATTGASSSLAVPEPQSAPARSIAEESIPEEGPTTNMSGAQQRQQ